MNIDLIDGDILVLDFKRQDSCSLWMRPTKSNVFSDCLYKTFHDISSIITCLSCRPLFLIIIIININNMRDNLRRILMRVCVDECILDTI